ncbi:MAG: hypothetical protein J6P60_00040 [Lachnospiraceae bacterium]|nr:hypothetical protein [Lachnospiraceae bacterium]
MITSLCIILLVICMYFSVFERNHYLYYNLPNAFRTGQMTLTKRFRHT